MSTHKGSINVTSENIFPVIKKFLYSDHEIFLRELVSNAVDATQKLKTLSSVGDFKDSIENLSVKIEIDKEARTLKVIDRGIGMTEEEIHRYINQIAFSGAEEFLEKYKSDANAIIGHFGLGFYSAFMVSNKVLIRTKSYKSDAPAIEWECDGSPEYMMKEIDKAERGTEIILFIDEENSEFLEKERIDTLLKKYCKYLPVPVLFGKKTEWKDGKTVELDEDMQINKTTPEWTKSPSELTDEDYKQFYRDLYPMAEEPLFWIHLNVDYPFNLTGVLYFPKLNANDFSRNKIQLYSNQVFITDSVEGVVPEFMTLLQGVIDSPDIPLNVSRSYLQSDANVKKISGYITRKVADRLQQIFNENRKDFEAKWDDIKVFMEYGMLSDEKFYDKAKSFALLKNTLNEYYTIEEYTNLVSGNQTDKDGQVVCLYANDLQTQYTYIEKARAKGYDVLLLDGQLDNHFVGMLEQKLDKTRFTRVDSDIIQNLIRKEDAKAVDLSEEQKRRYSSMFESQLPVIEKTQFNVAFESLGADEQAVVITQNEFMRRMKEMQAMQPGMSFYGEMPDSFNLTINTDNAIVNKIFAQANADLNGQLDPLAQEITAEETSLNALKADTDKATANQSAIKEAEDKIQAAKASEKDIMVAFAKEQPLVQQLLDLALLSNNMLKGEALAKFIQRSAELLK